MPASQEATNSHERKLLPVKRANNWFVTYKEKSAYMKFGFHYLTWKEIWASSSND